MSEILFFPKQHKIFKNRLKRKKKKFKNFIKRFNIEKRFKSNRELNKQMQ
ncbi:hypothetical protein Mgra_00000127 [Meloidogyne graminicola]|uniref:Uncharacterized protein n=1 Tax=Meloidogyne graminicola TaxID=189291 RepID=A0A8T0A5X3_9BILA|nr:hypothetical protein Mgra_00000127 [Meloidogyne graminicola]